MIARRALLVLSLTALLPLLSSSARAVEPDKAGWYLTGTGVRTKQLAFIEVRAYSISHWVKKLPKAKSKAAVIQLDADKRLAFRMLRDVGENKIKKMFRDAFELNGYRNSAKIEKILGVFTSELEEGTQVTIRFDAKNKTTTITRRNGGSATVPGADFMHATWSVWFGKSEQPSLGDDLISRL